MRAAWDPAGAGAEGQLNRKHPNQSRAERCVCVYEMTECISIKV